MRYDTYDDALKSGKGTLYRIDIVLFDLVDGCIDGTFYCGPLEDFECFFDDPDEATSYCRTFDADMARQALDTYEQGDDFENVSCEVLEVEVIDGDMSPRYCIACNDWYDNATRNDFN